MIDNWEYENSFFGVSENEREAIARECIAPSNYKRHKNISIVLNILVALISFCIFDFNLIALAISFVIFDLVMGFVDNFVCHIIPKMKFEKSKTMSLEDRENYVQKLEKKVEELEEKLKKFKKENCDNCTYYSYYSDSCKSNRGNCTIMDEYYHYRDILRVEKRKLEEERKKVEKSLLEKEHLVSSDFKNKLEYFETLRKRYSYFVEEKDMSYLNPIVVSLDNLISNLNNKPFALQFVPKTLNIYLDELQNVLDKIQGLSVEKQERYLKDIEKISKALSQNIDDLNLRIDRFESGSIEDTLNTLLGELVKGNNMEGENKDV